MPLFTIVVVFAVAIGLAIILVVIRGSLPASEGLPELEKRLQPVDIAAFLNLTSVEETDFLRRNVPPPAFRRLQKLRARAALQYLGTLYGNTAVLIRIGQLAQGSELGEVAEAGKTLANTALRTRLLVLRAYFTFLPQLWLGSALPSTATLLAEYKSVRDHFGALASGQDPMFASRSVPLL